MTVDIATVAEELYALPPGDFTATRNDRAKAAGALGDKALAGSIRSLPKPSAAAWAVNMLVRHRADDLAGILDLGSSLREAQEALDWSELKSLGQKRHALIASVARLGRELARELGNPISESAAGEVEQTLQAAMADPDAALAVRSGLLIRALTSTGLEPVDLSAAVAVPPTGSGSLDSGRTRPRGKAESAKDDGRAERELEKARREVADAERRADQARADLEAIERRTDDVARLREQLAAELDELRERLAEVGRDASAADHEARTLGRDHDRARRAVDAAERDLRRAREVLDERSAR